MTTCPAGNHPEGRHAWWPALRFRWPFGLLFRPVSRCLYCGTTEPSHARV